MIERGFWQHLPTGNIWAIETERHVPVRCAGPLDARDVDRRLLQYVDYSTAYLRLVMAEWSLYVPYELWLGVRNPLATRRGDGVQWCPGPSPPRLLAQASDDPGEVRWGGDAGGITLAAPRAPGAHVRGASMQVRAPAGTESIRALTSRSASG